MEYSKVSQLRLRPILFPFIALFGFFICYICMNQISLERETRNAIVTGTKDDNFCSISSVPPDELKYIHFPQPTTYKRGECACNPVRYFVLVSLQRSGSGWFETLLNSHPNISSNGEIFSIVERRANLSTIIKTLDSVYNLDWLTSAAKNECTAAFGLKWMVNQGISAYPQEVLSYFERKGVSVIFLFRRNLLRRLISLMANDYDRRAKQLNGTHKSHVHSKEEADILAKFKPKISPSTLIPNLQQTEKIIADCLHNFRNIRHMVLYYEDIINNQKALLQVQEFLKVPVTELVSKQVKIHTSPLPEQVVNWSEIFDTLNGTQYVHFLDHAEQGS